MALRIAERCEANEINDPASFAYGELRRDIINVVIILIIGSAMLSRGGDNEIKKLRKLNQNH